MQYKVQVLEYYSTFIDVVADNEQEAQIAASQIIAAGCYPDGTEYAESVYYDTASVDEWTVEQIAS